jgi:hypothetical protein
VSSIHVSHFICDKTKWLTWLPTWCAYKNSLWPMTLFVTLSYQDSKSDHNSFLSTIPVFFVFFSTASKKINFESVHGRTMLRKEIKKFVVSLSSFVNVKSSEQGLLT